MHITQPDILYATRTYCSNDDVYVCVLTSKHKHMCVIKFGSVITAYLKQDVLGHDCKSKDASK